MKNNRFIHEIKNDCSNITFIILCASKSNRRGYKNIPFSLVDNRLLIDKQISTINSVYNHSEIIIISGFESSKLINHIHEKKYKNVRIVENSNFKHSNTLDGWRIGLNSSLDSDIYIIHGDRVFNKDAIKNKNKKTHLITHDFDKNNYNLGIIYEQESFINISYGLPNVWSEICFISQKDFTISRHIINNCKNKKIYNIEGFINYLSEKIDISLVKKKTGSIKTLKEIK